MGKLLKALLLACLLGISPPLALLALIFLKLGDI